MRYEMYAVVDEYDAMGLRFHELRGYNVSVDGGPFEFMDRRQFSKWSAEQELKALEDRKAKIKGDLSAARKLRQDVDKLIEKLESEL